MVERKRVVLYVGIFVVLLLLITGFYEKFGSKGLGWFCYGKYSKGNGRATLWEAPYAPGTGSRLMRVVSLTPALTETVCDLGAGDCLVGVTDNDDYPEFVKKLPSVGDMYPNLELIAAAAPDLLVYDPQLLPAGVQSRFKALKNTQKLPLHLANLEDLRQILPVLGQALQRKEAADKLAVRLEDKIERLEKASSAWQRKPRVFLAIWPNPIVTVGKTSYIDGLITWAGGRNCYGELNNDYPTVSLEDLVRQNPDLVIMSCSGMSTWEKSPGWKSLPAVMNKRVYFIPAGLLHRPTMRCLEGTELMQRYCWEVAKDMTGELGAKVEHDS